MVEIVDGFGTWDDLGTVEPKFEVWLGLSEFTRSKSSTLRLLYSALDYDNLTYGFVRCLYESRNSSFFGKWVRFYPKPLTDTILYPHPVDLLANNDGLTLSYQIQKRHRFRRYVGTKYSTIWTVSLQVFVAPKQGNTGQQTASDDFPTADFFGLL